MKSLFHHNNDRKPLNSTTVVMLCERNDYVSEGVCDQVWERLIKLGRENLQLG